MFNKRLLMLSMVIMLVIFLAIFTGCQSNKAEENGSQNGDNSNTDAEGIMLGEDAPEFSLENLDGKQVSLEDFKGKTVVLTFWETWCPTCKSEHPYIDSLFSKYVNSDIAILTVNLMQRDNENAVRSYMEEEGYDFPVLLAKDSTIMNDYRIRSIPSTYVIDSEGIIQYEKFGPIEEENFENIINDIASN